MKPKTILLWIVLFLSPAALGNNAGDDTDALLIAATYIYRRRERDDLPRIRHQPAGCGIYVQKRQNLQRRRQVHPVARRPVYDQRRKNFRGQQHLALRCRILHRRRADIPGQRQIRLVVRRVVYGKGRTVLHRGQFVHPRHSLLRQGRPGLRRSRGVHKYAIRCAVYDRIRGLLSIGGNPEASNLQTGVLEYTFRLRNTVHLLFKGRNRFKTHKSPCPCIFKRIHKQKILVQAHSKSEQPLVINQLHPMPNIKTGVGFFNPTLW